MNCELAHESIVMAVYGELPDDAAHNLERHLAACHDCAHERDQVQALKLLAETLPVREPDANLVARSRMRLEEALDALPPKRWLERLVQKLRNNAATVQAAPIAACLLLLAGAGAGSLGGYHFAHARAAKAEPPRTADVRTVSGSLPDMAQGAEIASVSSIVRQPNSQFVEVHYNQLVPQQVRGSLDDPAIRRLLMLAIESAGNAGVRDDSVGLLAAECRAGHGCQAAGIRDALMVALRYDRNAGVRQKALDGLQPYVAQDLRVRDAVLEALLNDSDPRIRTEAINILEPVEADTSVRQVLQSVATTDRNPRIRLVSRHVLSQVGEIQ
ncbi:MAG TPA: HEAT repeat domain-containing protein [Terracidiphilus sp.]|nr:HEAT repeat domain-containing protein [Terracidiphilus sp.]